MDARLADGLGAFAAELHGCGSVGRVILDACAALGGLQTGNGLQQLLLAVAGDARNAEEIGSLLPQSGFVMLCGGHVPTQNHFFAQLGLPGLFHNYHGIVLGVSAGSMHAAHIVYAAPGEPGEAADPHYSRWMNGLGLTETRILPHYQFIRDHVLDGQKVEDIALADSKKRHFLALPDGSYILCADGSEALYGRGWYFADGMMEEINEDEDVLPLR